MSIVFFYLKICAQIDPPANNADLDRFPLELRASARSSIITHRISNCPMLLMHWADKPKIMQPIGDQRTSELLDSVVRSCAWL